MRKASNYKHERSFHSFFSPIISCWPLGFDGKNDGKTQ
jgi:hypothetical protein